MTETLTTIDRPILDLISSRRSLRAYSDTPVSQEQIDMLFEAARWAPSSMNEQPWRYIYATKDQPLWEVIFGTLNEGNKAWAKEATLFIVSMTRNTFTRNGRPNPTAAYDLGAANAFLSLQATALGLNVHQMGGYDHEALRQLLHVSEELDLGVIMAVGFPGDAEQLPEALRLRELTPRTRHHRSEFVMNESF